MPYGVLAGGSLSGKYNGSSRHQEPDRDLAECRHRKTADFQPRYGAPLAMMACEECAEITPRSRRDCDEIATAQSLM